MNQVSEVAVQGSTPESPLKATVCFFIKFDDGLGWLVYLIVKGDKTGKGLRNGYGGKLEFNETPRKCTKREIIQETGGGIVVRPEMLRYVGLGKFTTTNEDGTRIHCEVNIFLAEEWVGREEHEDFFPTPEAYDGKWYPIGNLPLQELMPGDRSWLRTVLENNTSGGAFYLIEVAYGPNQGSLLGPVIVREIPQMEID